MLNTIHCEYVWKCWTVMSLGTVRTGVFYVINAFGCHKSVTAKRQIGRDEVYTSFTYC